MTTPREQPTYDAIAAAQSVQDAVREAAPEIEAERRLPRPLVDAFLDARLFHLALPASLGGPGIDPVSAARAVEEVSLADGAAGWCVMIAAQNAGFAGFLPPEEARRIWGPRDVVCGTARPIGRAVAEPGGYRVSGRWPFASGSSHATWFGGECEVYDGDAPRTNAKGDTVTRLVFAPREEVEIHDVWFTTGLRGTASNDFSFTDVFVPEARGLQMLVDPPRDPWPLYRALPLIFMNHGTQAIGVARGAIETAREVFTTRRGWGGVPLSEHPRMQTVMADAVVRVEAARHYLYQVGDELWRAVLAEGAGHGPPAVRARLRLATSHAAQSAVEAVDLLHRTVGTTGIMASSPLDRQFRDIHTAMAHVMIGPMTYEAAGRVEFGRDAEFPFF